jgi:hypothetical protein
MSEEGPDCMRDAGSGVAHCARMNGTVQTSSAWFNPHPLRWDAVAHAGKRITR